MRLHRTIQTVVWIFLNSTSCLMFADSVVAQPQFTVVDSLEYSVAISDTALVGAIGQFTTRADLTVLATLEMVEPIKGIPPELNQIQIPLLISEAKAERWKVGKNKLLVLIGQAFTTTNGNLIIDLDSGQNEVLAAGNRVLREPTEIIRTAKEAVIASNEKSVNNSVFVPVLKEEVPGTKWEKSENVRLRVLVDGRLEQLAVRRMQSVDLWSRLSGVRDIEHFKSEKNIELLKSMLNDPGWLIRSAEENDGFEERTSPVRRAAADTLKRWGVVFDQPVTIKLEARFDTVENISLDHFDGNASLLARELKRLTRYKNLRNLVLTRTKLDDNALGVIREHKNLQSLNIARTAVSDKSIPHLLSLAKLEYLNLAATKVSRSGLIKLAELKSLKEIDVSRLEFAEDVANELKTIRPDLKVTY